MTRWFGQDAAGRIEEMAHIVNVICQAAMKATAYHQQDRAEFAGVTSEQMTANLKAVLREELADFIANDLKEATQSGLGEGWTRQLINAQCNLWAIKALKAARGDQPCVNVSS